MRALLVGDPHVTPAELQDSENLLELVRKTQLEYGIATEDGPKLDVWFLGDLHNNHDALSVRVVSFWRRWFAELGDQQSLAWRGNHDQAYPDTSHPNAMASYPDVRMVDRPRLVAPGVCGMPYYGNPEEFVQDAVMLKAFHPQARTLICHQSFENALYDNGSPIKDGVRLDRVPFDFVIAGHHHRPQTVGKCWYPGAPRWRAIDDAPHDRFLHLLDFAEDGSYEVVTKIPTDQACRRIHHLLDVPGMPVDLSKVDLKKHDVRVDVYGDLAHVRSREQELGALGVRCRPFPTRDKAPKVSESEGVGQAFAKFAQDWRPPHGSDKVALMKEIDARLGG